jgi:hypothetical protein
MMAAPRTATEVRIQARRALVGLEIAAYAHCVAAAERGDAVTQNSINEAIGSYNSTGSTATGVLNRLVDAGYITKTSSQRGVEVCIVASGLCSARPRCQTPHWREIFERCVDSTPTLPKHKIATVPNLMAYLNTMMREENLTLEAAQISLMSRGMAHREAEQA